MKSKRFTVVVLIAICASLILSASAVGLPQTLTIPSAPTALGVTERVSIATDGTQGNAYSGGYGSSVSIDGRYVVFDSEAANLVSGDTNGYIDVFIYDRHMGQTTRVSVASNGTQGNDSSGLSSISGNGGYILFSSYASTLVNGDTNSQEDVFVHDLQTGQTTRVSVASDGTQGQLNGSEGHSISDDGRYVAFSGPRNLITHDTQTMRDIFVHDLQTGQTTRVSVASDGTEANNNSFDSRISADGRYVVFMSSASNLVPSDTNGRSDVFVHDRQTGQTTRVSIASDGTEANGHDSAFASISSDGRYVAFDSAASNLVSGDTNGKSDVFIHDVQTGQTTRVSVALNGTQGNGTSQHPYISADRRYVVYSSDASNLVSNDHNGWDIFIYNCQSGQTTLASVASDGTQANGGSDYPFISADGRYATFSSGAGNLVNGDTNGMVDVFVHEQRLPPGIDLTISLYRSVNITDRAAYEHIVEFFADAVYEMSNGAQQIRNVTIYQNGSNADTANVLWKASEWPRANPAGYNQAGSHIWMGDVFPFDENNPYDALASANWKGAGYSLGHEWGHYYYGLYDEYQGDANDNTYPYRPRASDLPVFNSIMSSQWNATEGNFNWLNFSISKNDTWRTAQHRMYWASGWETLARPPSQDPRFGALTAATARAYYPELTQAAPGTGQNSSLELPAEQIAARSALNTTWVDGVVGLNAAQPVTTYHGTIQSIPTSTIRYPQPALLVARAAKVDPIAKAGITATVQSPDHGVANLSLKDDGVPPDVMAADGLYSGILPYQQNGAHAITVTFNNEAGLAEFTQASAMHSIGPNGETYSPTVQLVGENFSVVVTATVVITNVKADDHGDTAQIATSLLATNVDMPGRIDHTGDVDMFKVTPHQTGTLVVRLSNLALGMQPQVRLLKGDGTTVIGTFDYQPEADGYFFTRLSAKAGESFYMEVTHHNSSATAGMYAVSAGKPLTNEYFKVDLPLIRR